MKHRRLPRLPPQRGIERLEDRLLLTGTPEMEPNNTISLANIIPVAANAPAAIDGQIDSSSDIDLYQISMSFGDTLAASIDALGQGSSLYSYLRLFDSSGSEITPTVSSENFGTDPVVTYMDQAPGSNATFYVGVSDFFNNLYDPVTGDNESSGLYTGIYTLNLTVQPLADSGDQLATATPVSLQPKAPQTLPGIIDVGGDVDLYQVTLKAGDTLDVTAPAADPGSLNTALRVFDAQGNSLEPGAGSSNSHLNFVAPSDGLYYVGITADDNTQYDANTSGSGTGSETGDYLATFLVTPMDNDDTLGTANAAPFLRDQPTLFSGSIANGLDVDFYRLQNLVAGDTLKLSVDTTGSSLQPGMRLFGPDGSQVASSADGSPIEVTIPSAGDYFVGVSGADNTAYDPNLSNSGVTPSLSLGDYQLSAEIDSGTVVLTETGSNDSLGSPNVIAPTGIVTGTITSGDVDYYMFTVTEPGLLMAQVNTPGSNLDSRLTLYGSDQQVRLTSDDATAGNVDPALQVHLVPGSYWLRIDASPAAALGAATGAYSLATTFTLANSPFAPQPTGSDSSSGLFPFGIASGDFNGDGVADLVTADNGSGQVSVLLGVNVSNNPSKPQGDFSYQPPQLYSVGDAPVAVVASEAANTTNLDGTVKEVPLDFNGDGFTDLAVVNSGLNTGMASVTILLGDGQGHFHHRLVDDAGNPVLDESGNPIDDVQVGSQASAVAVADFNGDGRPDLAVTNPVDGTVSIFLEQPDGSFLQSGSAIPVGVQPANPGDPSISAPQDIIAGDFDGDGKMDLATADSGSSSVTVLFGDGAGAFTTQTLNLPSRLPSDPPLHPTSLVAAKLNSDGFLDFAVVNSDIDNGSDDLTVILGAANRTFHVNDPVVVKNLPTTQGQTDFHATVVTADFNGDGHLDLALADIADPRITVVLGNGNGTFSLPGQQFLINPTSAPRDIVVGDFNNDGRMDFATADSTSQLLAADGNALTVSVFGGLGDGAFLSPSSLQTDSVPSSLAVADFNDDGHPDIVTANANNASLLLGNGDATFQSAATLGVAPSNIVAVGDFNGDGRTDIVTSDSIDPVTGAVLDQLSLLLGKGDGTFSPPQSIAAFPGVFFVVSQDADGKPLDFNGDGKPDLAVTVTQFDPSNPQPADNTVVILLGDGLGGFTAQTPIPVGSQPRGLVVGDFNGDGKQDLAVSNFGDGTVTVLFGDGVGGFVNVQTVPVGGEPGQLAVADFDNDGFQDIAVKSSADNQVTILFGAADGNFMASDARQLHLAVADNSQDQITFPEGIVAGDFNGDGLVDLATANERTADVSVFMNLGQWNNPTGTHFAGEQRFSISDSREIGSDDFSIVAADFNGDGRLDLATSNAQSNNVSILLGDGTGKFKLPDQFESAGSATAPVLADFNGDGTPDAVVIDAEGRVLLRLGRPGEPGTFAPPLVVNNQQLADGIAADDFALFNDGQQHLLGVLNRVAQGSQDSSFTLYQFDRKGDAIQVYSSSDLGGHYDRIIAAKLNGDNRDDLVAIDSANGMLARFFRNGQGFAPDGNPIPVAKAPSDLLAANLGVGGVSSLLVADQSSGALNVISGNSVVSYRGSTEADGFDPSVGAGTVPLALDGASAAVVGNFNDLDDSVPDVVVVHRGTNVLSMLLGKAGGAFVDPQPNQEIQTGSQPIDVAAGYFNGDKHLDLAVLDADGHVQIFLGDGHGNFHFEASYVVGTSPVSLAVYKVDGDSKSDLMVGDRYGDVLTLLGNGDGTFKPFTRVDQSMGIAVGNSGGQQNIAITNKSGDQIALQNGIGPPGSVQSTNSGTTTAMAPASVKLTDNLGSPINFNGDSFPDMVVADSGGNDVLVYLGKNGGGFDLNHPIHFYAGTDPVDVEVADVNGDGVQDVIVTNYGSNDVSILLGTGDSSDGGQDLLTPGARLSAGQGPVSTTVVQPVGSNTPTALLVTNSVSNNVFMLSARGGGFFNDASPTVFATGSNPTQTFVGNFNGTMGFVTLNSASNSLTFYSGFNPNNPRNLSSGGTTPLAAVAVDFNNDGMTDLIVGNNGNGVFSVFTGEQAGLSLMGSFSDSSLSHPAALAVGQFGQGKELQLLALDEGDESVHVFGRENLVGDPNNNLNSQLLAITTTSISSFLGLNSNGLSFAATLTAALGLSLEGVLSQTSDTAGAEGGGTDVNRLLPADLFDGLGTAVSSGKRLLESALESVGGVFGLKFDEHMVTQTVEDVVSLLFPHLPLNALPGLIHNLLGSANKKNSPASVAVDQVMEDYDAHGWADEILPVLSEAFGSALVPQTSQAAQQVAAESPMGANINFIGRRELNALGEFQDVQFNSVSPMFVNEFAPRNSSNPIFAVNRGAPLSNEINAKIQPQAEVWHDFHRMSALAAVMGAIGVGGWLYQSRRQRDETGLSNSQ